MPTWMGKFGWLWRGCCSLIAGAALCTRTRGAMEGSEVNAKRIGCAGAGAAHAQRRHRVRANRRGYGGGS